MNLALRILAALEDMPVSTPALAAVLHEDRLIVYNALLALERSEQVSAERIGTDLVWSLLPAGLSRLRALRALSPEEARCSRGRPRDDAGAAAMTPEEVLAAMRSEDGCACTIAEMNEAFLAIAAERDRCRRQALGLASVAGKLAAMAGVSTEDLWTMIEEEP